MKLKPLPPIKYLRECVRYDPITGQLFWNKRPRSHFNSDRIWNSWNAKHAGNQAFTSCNQTGHLFSPIDYVLYVAHRVAWKLMTGRDPVEQIDHKNRNPADNRWSNIREATHAQNVANRKRPKTNTNGFMGIYCVKGRWKAHIKNLHLGTFDSKEEAILARRAAEQLHYGEFAPQ